MGVCVCLHVCACELVAGIKDVMQDYPAGRLTTSTAGEEMARRRGWRDAGSDSYGGVYKSNSDLRQDQKIIEVCQEYLSYS